MGSSAPPSGGQSTHHHTPLLRSAFALLGFFILLSLGGCSLRQYQTEDDQLYIGIRKIEVVEDKNSNPILRLKKERNLLQFVPFTKKISKKDAFAAFSNDMNRLYSRLSDNYQIFIPIN